MDHHKFFKDIANDLHDSRCRGLKPENILIHGKTALELQIMACKFPTSSLYPMEAVDVTKPMTIFGIPIILDDRIELGSFELRIPPRGHTFNIRSLLRA